MAYTLEFGIAFAALTLGLGLSAVTSAEATPQTTNVGIKVNGLRSVKGNVLVCLTANPKAFPDCSKDPNAARASIAAAQAGDMRMAVPRPGGYAIALVHDENANGKLDTSLGLPKEGFGFSRNPTIVFGPPSFSAAQFTVSAAGADQSVKMKYML
jgi:uncharacterized protein (DUF2141 family)